MLKKKSDRDKAITILRNARLLSKVVDKLVLRFNKDKEYFNLPIEDADVTDFPEISGS